jgi:RimJ/RimL family protein N-acetyltransferase
MSEPAWPRRLRTDRLDLLAITPADAAAVHRITADPRHCEYVPGGLQESRQATLAWIERRASRWDTGGLGYWTARRPATGELIGLGGAERRPGFWNLYYLIDQANWGRGYATELARATQRTAAELDPALPLVAWIHAGNGASVAVARHLGLTDYGLLEPGHWKGEPMHCWADRDPAPSLAAG